MKKSKEILDGYRLSEHTYCIADEMLQKGVLNQSKEQYKSCGSSDALSTYVNEYEDGSEEFSSYCWSCSQSFKQDHLAKSSLAGEFGLAEDGQVVEKKTFERKPKAEPITPTQRRDLFNLTGGTAENKWITNSAKGYRNLSDESIQFYGFRVELKHDGSVKAFYFPETCAGKIMGYKSRHDPKGFGFNNIGRTGASNDLSGQSRFPDGGRTCVIVGGEFDMIAAQDMFRKDQCKRGYEDYNRIAVVSPTTGEGSAASQCRNQYEWFDKFDNIVIGLDNDEVGREAALALAEVLPKEKVKIARWSGKDPNKMLMEGKERQFMSDYYKAEEYIKSGIVGSSKLEEAIFDEIGLDKIPLPPFMSQLQSHMAGGIPLGYIVNLIADTGCGKTTIANECVYDWIFNSPYKVGIVSLELDTGQYGISLLSRHLNKKIQLFQTKEEAREFLNTQENIEKRRNLWTNEYGEDRFHLLDDRDGDLESLKKKILQMILQYECKFLIIDPLQDALDGYSNEDQAVFMKWMKQMVKRYKVSFFNVNHVRKEGNSGFDRFLKEADIQGSSAIAKSAGCNIIFTRDKLAEDSVSRNVTKVFIPKCRWTGSTGDGGLWYYSLEQHTLYDLETYFKDNPDKVPFGMSVEELIEEQKAMHSRDKNKKDNKSNNTGTKKEKPKAVNDKDFMDDLPI